MEDQKNTLFTDSFPLVDSDDELNRVKKKFIQYDPYYIASGCIEERKEKLDVLWNIFKPYKDSHFLEQYKIQFHKRTWEMYIGCVLLENKFLIKSLDKGPDFIIADKEYIECVACSRGDLDKQDSVPEMFVARSLGEMQVQDVPVEKMILRITSVVKDKHEKYQKWDNIDKNKPFIVAVNTAELQHPQDYLGIPLIIKALFGLQFLRISQSGDESFSWRKNAEKSDSLIPVDGFTNDLYKGISGIIFSDRNVISHPDKIGEDCIFVNNPFAKNPVDLERFSFLKRWYAENGKLTKLY